MRLDEQKPNDDPHLSVYLSPYEAGVLSALLSAHAERWSEQR